MAGGHGGRRLLQQGQRRDAVGGPLAADGRHAFRRQILVDHAQQPVHGRLDFHIALARGLVGILRGRNEALDGTINGGQRRAEFMRQHRSEAFLLFFPLSFLCLNGRDIAHRAHQGHATAAMPRHDGRADFQRQHLPIGMRQCHFTQQCQAAGIASAPALQAGRHVGCQLRRMRAQGGHVVARHALRGRTEVEQFEGAGIEQKGHIAAVLGQQAELMLAGARAQQGAAQLDKAQRHEDDAGKQQEEKRQHALYLARNNRQV
ncbi:hypothetical protein D3C81_1252920 [compost metagenome]